MIRKSLTLLEEHEEWIQDNSINLSKFVRKHINREIALHSHNKNVEPEDGSKSPSDSSPTLLEARRLNDTNTGLSSKPSSRRRLNEFTVKSGTMW